MCILFKNSEMFWIKKFNPTILIDSRVKKMQYSEAEVELWKNIFFNSSIFYYGIILLAQKSKQF